MSLRTGLFASIGLLSMAAMAQTATAMPIDPAIECREPDLVVREFHLTEKRLQENPAGPLMPRSSKLDEQVTPATLASLVLDAWVFLITQLPTPR